jgi:UrcA family protein
MINVQKILMLTATVAGGATLIGVRPSVYRGDEHPAVSVRSDDLDFRHVPDAMVLFDRIEDASVKACGGTPAFGHFRQAAAFDRCRVATIRQTVRQMNWTVLTEVAENQAMPPRIAVR